MWLETLKVVARSGREYIRSRLPKPGAPNSIRVDLYEEQYIDKWHDSRIQETCDFDPGLAPGEKNEKKVDIAEETDERDRGESIEEICDAEGFGGQKISNWQAAWNVTNAIQGMSLVSLPYAVRHGGYSGLFSLIFVAYICCHTGKILVDCLYERDKKTGKVIKVRGSYVEIAQACFGPRYGGKIVNTAQVIELVMTCILYVVLCGDLMIGAFPEGLIDMRSWMVICSLTLIPCAYLKNLQSVSTSSLWCAIIHFAINAIMFAYCFLHIKEWHFNEMTFRADPATFPICLGIVVFSYTSQIFLPSLEGNMNEPHKFDTMLDWSHIAAAFCKALFAYVCFLTFGNETQEVISNNLPDEGMIKTFVNLTLVVKALLSYPLPYFAAAHMLEVSFFRRKPTETCPDGVGDQPFKSMWTKEGDLKSWAIGLRIILVSLTTIAAVSIPHFALLLGFIGSLTGTMLSFVWPCLFHMQLRWDELNVYTRVWEIFIICIGIFFGITGMYSSLMGLIEVGMVPITISNS